MQNHKHPQALSGGATRAGGCAGTSANRREDTFLTSAWSLRFITMSLTFYASAIRWSKSVSVTWTGCAIFQVQHFQFQKRTASDFSKRYPTSELHTSPFLTFGKEAGGRAEKPACTKLVVLFVCLFFSLVLLWISTACLSIQGQSLVQWSSSGFRYRREWGAKKL